MTFTTFLVPQDEDSFLYFTGRLPFAGELSGAEFHAHQTNFDSAVLAAADPSRSGTPEGTARQPLRCD